MKKTAGIQKANSIPVPATLNKLKPLISLSIKGFLFIQGTYQGTC